jgi:Calx-beta domain-containing protein
LSFPALSSKDTAKTQTATFSVPVIDDKAVEPSETVNLQLKGSRTATVGGGRAVLTIVDDDGASRLSFESASATVAETAGATSVTVIRSGDASDTAAVTYGASANGTAAAGDWSFASTDHRLELARNQRIASFGVTLHDNADVDGARTLELSLASPLRATLEEPLLTTLTIVDDETPSILRFDPAQYDVNEADGVATLTVTRAGSFTGRTVTVDYSVHGVDATADADYTDSSGTLTIDGPDPDDPSDPGDM